MGSRVGIFGSCVTRDAFEFIPSDFQLAGYISRSSVISCMADPLPQPIITEQELSEASLSPFEQRMVLHDVNKTGLDHLLSTKPDVIVVDLIDERFAVLKVNGSFITDSAAFAKTEARKRLPAGSSKYTIFGSNTLDLWEEAARSFAKKITSGGQPIILHKSYWAYNYLDDADGQMKSLGRDGDAALINKNLEIYHRILENLIPGAIVIEPPEGLRVADAKHKWTVAPFHFLQEYYKYFMEQLQEKIK